VALSFFAAGLSGPDDEKRKDARARHPHLLFAPVSSSYPFPEAIRNNSVNLNNYSN
jgi:hypothetical protein